MGVTASEAYDGKPGQTYEFKTMLHKLHKSGRAGAELVIYRTRGIYAWIPEGSTLPNWATGTTCAGCIADLAGNHPGCATSSSTRPRRLQPPAGMQLGTPGNIVYGADTRCGRQLPDRGVPAAQPVPADLSAV